MRCEDITEVLLEVELGELDEDAAARVHAHLESCPKCQAFAKTYTAVQDMVKESLAVEVSEALQAELDAALLDAIRKTG